MVDVQSRSSSSVSNLPPYFSIQCFPFDGLRNVVYSGPDGLADYRSHLLVDSRPIGTNQYSTEGTYDTDYLWRTTPLGTPVHLRPRSSYAGEIGWHSLILCRDRNPSRTGHQKLLSEFWRQAEDESTHRYQNPWYPGPGEVGDPDRGGYYFRRFPSRQAPRARTSYDFRSDSARSAGMTSGSMTSQQRQPWRRTPAATPFTVYGETDVVNVEQGEEGGGGGESMSSEQGSNKTKNNPRLLTARYSPGPEETSRQQDDTSATNSYTTYARLRTPSSSQGRRHY